MYTYKYMGKNYTLYIKETRLDNEDNKSGLINHLLTEHYDRLEGPIIKDKYTGIRFNIIPKAEAAEDLPPPRVISKPQLKACKHGADPKFCKHAKPGKPCK